MQNIKEQVSVTPEQQGELEQRLRRASKEKSSTRLLLFIRCNLIKKVTWSRFQILLISFHQNRLP